MPYCRHPLRAHVPDLVFPGWFRPVSSDGASFCEIFDWAGLKWTVGFEPIGVMPLPLMLVKADMYSYGVVLWELCTLQKPFAGMSSYEHARKVNQKALFLYVGATIYRGCSAAGALLACLPLN